MIARAGVGPEAGQERRFEMPSRMRIYSTFWQTIKCGMDVACEVFNLDRQFLFETLSGNPLTRGKTGELCLPQPESCQEAAGRIVPLVRGQDDVCRKPVNPVSMTPLRGNP